MEPLLDAVECNIAGMVFQDPMSSLNPTMTIGDQIAESVLLHRDVARKAALDRAVEVLGLVGMPKPAERVGYFPHQLSGGLRQRVMIAMALACEPKWIPILRARGTASRLGPARGPDEPRHSPPPRSRPLPPMEMRCCGSTGW